MYGKKLFLLCCLLASTLASFNRLFPVKKEEWMKSAEKRIIGGTPSDITRYPWFASLEIEIKEGASTGFIVCGGTLISPKLVLTAGHCLNFATIISVRAYFNCRDFINCGLVVNARTGLTFPDYKPDQFSGDYAVLLLEKALDISPITLASNSFNILSGIPVSVIGFGVTNVQEPEISLRLMEVDLTIVDQQQCENQYLTIFAIVEDLAFEDVEDEVFIVENELCAIGKKKSSCQGDSGGPLFLRCDSGETDDVQVGVVSFGLGCAVSQIPGVYSNLADDPVHSFLLSVADRFNETINFFDGQMEDFCSGDITLNPIELEIFDEADWTCKGAYFADGEHCDCGCGPLKDPDCDVFTECFVAAAATSGKALTLALLTLFLAVISIV